MRRLNPLLIAMVLAGIGCGTAETSEAPDSCPSPAESWQLVQTPECFVYPEGPYGVQEGDTLDNFTLDDCDGGPVAFDQALSQGEIVLLSIGAGWCAPCIEETRTMDVDLFQRFRDRGLRIIQIIFEDANARPVTSVSCQRWVDQYNLSFPVLKDPLFTVEAYFTDHLAQTPLNFLVDRNGRIVYRSEGGAPDDLAERIDAALPE